MWSQYLYNSSGDNLKGIRLGKDNHKRNSKSNQQENVGKQEIEHSVSDSSEIKLKLGKSLIQMCFLN